MQKKGGSVDGSEDGHLPRGGKRAGPSLDTWGTPETKRSAVVARQDQFLRNLALIPPPGSPYADTVCLDVVRNLAPRLWGSHGTPAVPPPSAVPLHA